MRPRRTNLETRYATIHLSDVRVASIPLNPYVEAGDLIYVSGTVAQDESGAIIGRGDVAVQTRRTLERIREVLQGAGSSLDRAVAVAIYLRSASDFQIMNAAYRAFWPDDPPTRTTVVTDLVISDALVEISMVAASAGAERTFIHPGGWALSPNPYSYAIRTADTLFLSGLVSRKGRDNSVVEGTVATQTRVIMDNAGELLNAAGMNHSDIVSARVFLPDTETFPEMNAAYRPYFPGAAPARATVQTGLAGREYSVEITLIASTARREAINIGTPNPNLSGAIRAGQRLYLSGMLGNAPEYTGNVTAETRETLARVGATLDAAGFAPADIVDGLIYVTDVSAHNAMSEVYRTFFGQSFPARTMVRSGLMAPGAVVEIMFTAFKKL